MATSIPTIALVRVLHGAGYGPGIPDYANAKVELTPEGRFRVYAGVADMGQGNAERFAIPGGSGRGTCRRAVSSVCTASPAGDTLPPLWRRRPLLRGRRCRRSTICAPARPTGDRWPATSSCGLARHAGQSPPYVGIHDRIVH
ncbi:MAG: hypothetical protein WCI75_08605 [candidate division NC10 bacterium]